MKKYLLIFFVFFGLNTQAQFLNYCDSISISFTSSSPTSVTYQITPFTFPATFLVNSDWTVTDFNSGAIITTDTSWTPTFTFNPLDTVLVCLNLTLTGNGMTQACTYCDTITFNLGGGWVQMYIQPTSVSEINNERKLLKVTDILGRNAKGVKNTPLFYIYEDGTVEKKMIVE